MKVLFWSAGALAGLILAATSHASAQTTQRLMPESLNLEVVDGSLVPSDCMYPASITDATRFETSCVTMPRVISSEIGSQYIGQLGQAGWRQGDYISGGMTATRTDENNCQRVLNIFPSDYPPGQTTSDIVVLWFALDRTPRCNQAQPG